MELLFATYPSWSLLVIRLALGIIFFAHGAQKVFGWFGGHGFKGTMKYFTDKATNVEKKRTHRSF